MCLQTTCRLASVTLLSRSVTLLSVWWPQYPYLTYARRYVDTDRFRGSNICSASCLDLNMATEGRHYALQASYLFVSV